MTPEGEAALLEYLGDLAESSSGGGGGGGGGTEGGGADVAGAIDGAMGALSSGLASTAPMIGEAIGGPAGEAVGSALQPVIEALLDPIGTMKSVVDGVKGTLDQVVNAVQPFVEAFAPTTVLVFDQAMRDVNAVIGSALVPIMRAATVVVRGFGEAMMPVMAKLEPVIAQMTDAFMKLLMPLVNMWSGELTVAVEMLGVMVEAFLPVITVWEGFASAIRVVNAILTGAAQALTAFAKVALPAIMGFLGISGATTNFKSALQSMAIAVLKAAAALAKFVGLDSFILGMKKAFGAETEAGSTVGFAAAQGAQVTEVPSWVQSLAAAASMASGQVGQSAEDQFRADSLEALEGVEKGEDEIKKWLEKAKVDFFKMMADLPGALARAIATRAVEQVSHVKDGLQKQAGDTRRWQDRATEVVNRLFGGQE